MLDIIRTVSILELVVKSSLEPLALLEKKNRVRSYLKINRYNCCVLNYGTRKCYSMKYLEVVELVYNRIINY